MITHKSRTFLGDIPNEWETAILLDTLSDHRSGDWGADRGEAARSVLRSTNFTSDGTVRSEDVATRFLASGSAERLSLKAGDLLLERSGGGPTQPVGRIAFVDSDMPAFAFSNFIQRLRIDPGEMDPGFVGWVLYELNRSGIVERLQHQTTQMRNLEYRDYLGIRLPKPPREEQVAIAEAIWKSARALIKAKEMLTAAQRLKTALMQQLFANGIPGSHSVFSPITVFHRKSNMPETWEASRLGESITKIDYGTNAPSNDFRAGYPVLAIPQVVAPRLELGEVPYADLPEPEATALRLQDGDVLLIRTNGNPNYIGKSTLVTSAVASQHVVFASYLIRIRTDKARLSGAYLNYFLASPLGRQQALAMANTSAGNHNLGSRSIKRFVLPRPDIKEQGEIVSILDRGEDVLDKINQEIASLVLLKTSLLQNLLTGKVRVNLEAPYDFHRIQDR